MSDLEKYDLKEEFLQKIEDCKIETFAKDGIYKFVCGVIDGYQEVKESKPKFKVDGLLG
jgi:hypothetical protein